VVAVYLVHGTFVGPDALGVLAELARVFPKASNAVRRLIKRAVNKITGEAGNYTRSYARLFESAINRPDQPGIPVHLFNWSSENHHIGRADGAVRLINELASLELKPGQRVLLWGHSHAGNVFALMTNLLAGHAEAVESFFKAADGDYVQQLGIAGTNVMPNLFAWRSWLAEGRLNDLLQAEASPGSTLDRFRAGAIVPDEGTTLLVDYGPPEGNIAQHVAGHAVYTARQWLLFHAEQIAQQFYANYRRSAA